MHSITLSLPLLLLFPPPPLPLLGLSLPPPPPLPLLPPPRHLPYPSCCMWFAVLYMGVLTVMVLLVAAFTGYILVSTWQMDESNNSTTIALHDNINKFKEGT